MLFPLWSGNPHRATRDMDLLGRGPPDTARLEATFREIAVIPDEDGDVSAKHSQSDPDPRGRDFTTACG